MLNAEMQSQRRDAECRENADAECYDPYGDLVIYYVARSIACVASRAAARRTCVVVSVRVVRVIVRARVGLRTCDRVRVGCGTRGAPVAAAFDICHSWARDLCPHLWRNSAQVLLATDSRDSVLSSAPRSAPRRQPRRAGGWRGGACTRAVCACSASPSASSRRGGSALARAWMRAIRAGLLGVAADGGVCVPRCCLCVTAVVGASRRLVYLRTRVAGDGAWRRVRTQHGWRCPGGVGVGAGWGVDAQVG